jgi:hypothetical protein
MTENTLTEMSDLIELCLKQQRPAVESIKLVQALAVFGPAGNHWLPVAPNQHAFYDYYAALANALLFVNEPELEMLGELQITINDILVSIKKSWSHTAVRFSYMCVAGVTHDHSYTTAGAVHDQVQSELNGDPVF